MQHPHKTAFIFGDRVTPTAKDKLMPFVDYDDYVSTPRSTDPAEIIEEKNLAIAFLIDLIAKRDAEIQERERIISGLHAELARTNP